MPQPARLTGHLLARKGDAAPAGSFAATTLGRSQRVWSPHPRPRLCGPDEPSSPRQVGSSRPVALAEPEAAKDQRVALTVRLDPARHARLRIFCARRRRTSQDVMIKALDAYLQACGPDCACMESARCRSRRS